MGLQPAIFPINPKPVRDITDLQISCYHYFTDDFKSWLMSNINKATKTHKRTHPVFNLWHLQKDSKQDSLSNLSEKQILLTFHETDSLTDIEKNTIANYSSVLVTSKYTKNVFDTVGASNVQSIRLGFDDKSFKKLDKKYHPEGVISFGLTGKLEYRKRHLDVLRLWAQRFGGDRRFFLNCSVFNQFIPAEQQGSLIGQALEGKRYYNINFNPFMDRNDAFNDYLNSNHIVLGMSGAEGWGLPEFQSVGVGKHAVILNATGYQEWATEENAVLVEPTGQVDMHDGMFFHKGSDYNQGNSFTWNGDDFHAAIDKAMDRVRANPVNTAGLKIKDEFKWEDTAKAILAAIESV